MKLKENQEKTCHFGVSNPQRHALQKLDVHGAERSTAVTSRPPSRPIFTERYNLYRTSEPDKLVASKQQREFL